MSISSMNKDSFGSVSSFHLGWNIFKEATLSVTIKGYLKMKIDQVARPEWEEDTFTLQLRNYIREQIDDDSLPIVIETQQQEYTSQMHSGDESTKSASIIDLKLFRPLDKNSDEFYFAWECKRIGLADSGLRSKYISEGLIRFIKGDYSSKRASAGMIGYILDSDATTLANEINASMLRRRTPPPLSLSDHLTLGHPIESFSDIYTSSHKRLNGLDNIDLYHLLLTFVWATKLTTTAP